jgi:hypothetical protein
MKKRITNTGKSASTIPEVQHRKAGRLNAPQRHIQSRAGTWNGKISGVELLKRTRP